MGSAELVFGISKSKTVKYIDDVIDPLLTFKGDVITLTVDYAQTIAQFESICGFPNVVVGLKINFVEKFCWRLAIC